MHSLTSLDDLIVSQSDFDRYNGHQSIERFELPRPVTDDSTTSINPNEWSSRDIAEWLRSPRQGNVAGEPTMNVVMIQTRNQSTARWKFPIQRPAAAKLAELRPQTQERQQHGELVREIFTEMGFPMAAFGSYIKGHLTFVCVPRQLSNRAPMQANAAAYYCSGTSWAITWIYHPARRHTEAVLLHREGDGDDRKADVIKELLRLQSHLGHPMLLGYIKTKISLGFTFDMLDDMNSETLTLEKTIGFPTWDWILDRETKGKPMIDFESLEDAVGRFNVLSGKLTNIRFRLRTFLEQIKFISRCNFGHHSSLNPSDTKSRQECKELEDMMNIIWDYTNVHLYDADTLAERLGNQMQSVRQLTSQRDSRASIDIAEQGKVTNSSMMTIAFVSLLFLPGTFVASFFAIPMFDWKPSPGGDILIAEPFWIYWTVSGLLTLTLGLGWYRYDWGKRKTGRDDKTPDGRTLMDRIRRRRRPGRIEAMDLDNNTLRPERAACYNGKGDIEMGCGRCSQYI